MTEREPDNLYDALRDRLADYGQEPPAPLWANIRAQLPPPVATPQLRRRARRRWLAALALLLLVGLSTWQWWQPSGRGTARQPLLATRVADSHSAPASRPSASRSAASAPARPAMAPDATARQVTKEEQAHSASTLAEPASSSTAGTLPSTAAQAGSSAVAGNWPKANASISSARISSAPPLVVAGSRATRAARVGKPNTGSAVALASRSSADEALAAGSLLGAPIDGSPGGVKLPATTQGETASAHAHAARTASRPALAAAATRPAPPITAAETTATAIQPPVALTTAKATTAAETTAAQATVVAGWQQRPETTPTLQAERENWQPAAQRLAALLLQSSLLPPLLPRADSLPPLPVPAVRRWAVQALAGPALTSRQLGARPQATLPIPTSSFVPRSVTSSGSAENEQATTGFGAEVQLQRQLTGRWSVGTGLGYQAFATSQTVNLHVVYTASVAGAFRPDSVGTLAVRNTYHFLTLPLRVGYQLGTERARLRYGLRAGADVAFYLGGRSTEGSTSGAVSRNWGASGTPYRPFSLALSLGAEVRYRLAPGWELLAQPTLTHFVTSVARPVSGYVPRYPVAATALVGVAYWLH